jgi:glyoxalase superfamily protein
VLRIDAIAFDCGDAAPLARFWAAALGWSIAPYDEDELTRLQAKGIVDPEDDPSVMLEPPEGSGSPVLFFTEVPEPKVTKNRVHLDLVAPTSVEEEVERLTGLGATLRNWAEDEATVWAVMLDPEGNEFCVMPPDDLDDDLNDELEDELADDLDGLNEAPGGEPDEE